MATQIIIKNAAFTNSIGFVAPVALNLAAWFWLGGANTLVDQSANKANGVLQGTPTVGTNYVSFAPGAGASSILTSVKDVQGDMTLLAVGRSFDTFAGLTTQPRLISNAGTDPNYANYPNNLSGQKGINLLVSGGTSPQASLSCKDFANESGSLTAVNSGSVSVTNFQTFRFLACSVQTVSNVTTRTIYDMTGGTSNSSATASGYTRCANATQFLNIGAQPGGGTGSNDMAFAAIYTSALSAQQIGTIYAFVKNRLSNLNGITGL